MAVVAGAMRDETGRCLLQKRPAGKRHAGLWEFPGGKIERGETGGSALVRELNEELTITVDPNDLQPVASASAAAGDGEPGVVITLYTVTGWCGIPVPEPGADLGWFTHQEIVHLPLPPLDRELAARLAELAG